MQLMTSTASNNNDLPARQEYLKTGANLTVSKLVEQIYYLDQVIALWNAELKRAQPLLSGRLIFRNKASKIFIEDEIFYDQVPTPGKMVKKLSGAWRFVWLDKGDSYKKLSDLRVGKSMGSDRVVVRLIDGIESLLDHRLKLSLQLTKLRSESRYLLSSASGEFERRIDELKKLKPRIKLDWHNDADAAFEVIRQKNLVKNKAKAKRDL
jgi:hypothetical protein